MPKIKMRDGRDIFVRDMGKGDPIVLLHGFGMQSAHWLPFVLPLTRNHRFLMPDMRGFGQSHHTVYNQACVLTNYADDLADLLEHYQVARFKLVGISMGAFAALQYLKLYGDGQVERYLHIDQGPRCSNREDWSWGLFGSDNQVRLESARKIVLELKPYIKAQTSYPNLPTYLRQKMWQELGDFICAALSKPMQKALVRKICAIEQLALRLVPVDNWSAYMHCIQAYLEQDYDMREIFSQLRIPVSLIVGLKSEMYPCGGQLRIADYVQHCEIIPFAHSGHTPLIDQPLKFFNELRRFAAA